MDIKGITPEEATELAANFRELADRGSSKGQLLYETLSYMAKQLEKGRAIILSANARRHRLLPGQCKYCDEQTSEHHPSHDAASHCESGKKPHCSCDVCF